MGFWFYQATKKIGAHSISILIVSPYNFLFGSTVILQKFNTSHWLWNVFHSQTHNNLPENFLVGTILFIFG